MALLLNFQTKSPKQENHNKSYHFCLDAGVIVILGDARVVVGDAWILTRGARRQDLDGEKTNISIIDNKQNILRNIRRLIGGWWQKINGKTEWKIFMLFFWVFF